MTLKTSSVPASLMAGCDTSSGALAPTLSEIELAIQKSESLIEHASESFDAAQIPDLLKEMSDTLNILDNIQDKDARTTHLYAALHLLYTTLKTKERSDHLFHSESPTRLPSQFLQILPSMRDLSSPVPQAFLGEGAFAKVTRVDIGTVQCALKKVHKNKKGSLEFFNPKKLEKEAALLMALDHPNVIHMICFSLGSTPTLWLEYANEGSLSNNFPRHRLYEKNTVKLILKGITEGLNYLHSHAITHRDLHAGNVVLHKESDATPLTPKIIDLELASPIGNRYLPSNPTCHSPELLPLDDDLYRRANHVLLQKIRAYRLQGGPKLRKYNEQHDYINAVREGTIEESSKVDTWSLGMLAFAILSGGQSLYQSQKSKPRNMLLTALKCGHPHYLAGALRKRRHFTRGLQLGIPFNDPFAVQLLNDVVAPCFQMDQEKRPSAEDLLERIEKITL